MQHLEVPFRHTIKHSYDSHPSPIFPLIFPPLSPSCISETRKCCRNPLRPKCCSNYFLTPWALRHFFFGIINCLLNEHLAVMAIALGHTVAGSSIALPAHCFVRMYVQATPLKSAALRTSFQV